MHKVSDMHSASIVTHAQGFRHAPSQHCDNQLCQVHAMMRAGQPLGLAADAGSSSLNEIAEEGLLSLVTGGLRSSAL